MSSIVFVVVFVVVFIVAFVVMFAVVFAVMFVILVVTASSNVFVFSLTGVTMPYVSEVMIRNIAIPISCKNCFFSYFVICCEVLINILDVFC